MAKEHIFVVEDEPKISELLRDYLFQEKFTVTCLDRGDEVVARVKKEQPALILLDIMLPGMDGIQVCREIRKFSNIPILMLTAKVEEIDRIIGLEIGADDYICKPFSPREVIARVKAVLRRTYAHPDTTQMIAGPLSLNAETHQVTIDGQPLKLTPSEFGLLMVMMKHPGRVFSRSELLDRVQGYQFEGYDRTIDSHIKNLRRKVARKLPDQDIIQTVYGVGYQFIAPE
ncbi:MAG: response regulator [Desulfobacterales bacterium]|nr:response regulator [Desulfobacterales bacterium]